MLKVFGSRIVFAISLIGLVIGLGGITPAHATTSEGYWGEAPWVFENGVLTVDGGIEGKRELVTNGPWKTFEIVPESLKEIRLVNGENIVFPVDSSYLFGTGSSQPYGDLRNLEKITGLDRVDTSKVITAERMFYWYDETGDNRESKIETLEGVENWDVSNIVNMKAMFSDLENLKSLDLSDWDTSSVEDLSWFVSGNKNLKKLDLSGWDTSKVKSMNGMFSDTFSNEATLLGVEEFDTSSLEEAVHMFSYTHGLKELNLSGWETPNLTNVDRMFSVSDFETIDVSNWDMTGVESLHYMFSFSDKIEKLKGLDTWDTSNIKQLDYTFTGLKSVKELDVANWDAGNVETMAGLFSSTYSLKSLNISEWDVSKVEDMESLFYWGGAQDLIFDLSKWDTGRVKNFYRTFKYARFMNVGDLSNWDTSNAETMEEMFYNSNINDNDDLSNWDVSKVENMSSMFRTAWGFKDLNLSNWDVRNVEKMNFMFESEGSLTKLNLDNWDTRNVEEMNKMFYDVEELQEITIGEYTSLTLATDTVDLKDWEQVGNPSNTFNNLEELFQETNGGRAVAGTYVRSIEEYSISYDLNGGEGSFDEVFLKPDALYSIPVETPTLEGNDFVGWEYESDTYSPGDDFTMPDHDVVFKAVWEEGLVDITPAYPEVIQPSCDTLGNVIDGRIITGTTEGITYTVEGEFGSGDSATVIAVAEEGYRIVAQDPWVQLNDTEAELDINFEQVECYVPAVVELKTPEITQPYCDEDGNIVNGSVIIPEHDFPENEIIHYEFEGGYKPGETLTIKAWVVKGFQLGGEEPWVLDDLRREATYTITFENIKCEKPVEPEKPTPPPVEPEKPTEPKPVEPEKPVERPKPAGPADREKPEKEKPKDISDTPKSGGTVLTLGLLSGLALAGTGAGLYRRNRK